MNGVSHGMDVLVLPTRTEGDCNRAAATVLLEIYDECVLTLPANVTGLPAVQMPGFVRRSTAISACSWSARA